MAVGVIQLKRKKLKHKGSTTHERIVHMGLTTLDREFFYVGIRQLPMEDVCVGVR
jgi:hypothetical protein